MRRRPLLSLLPLLPAVFALSVLVAAPAAQAQSAEASGEVVRVDRAGARVGIRHGEIATLDIPAMTMNYRVRDAAALEGLNPGDRVRFTVERTPGGLTVTRLARAG